MSEREAEAFVLRIFDGLLVTERHGWVTWYAFKTGNQVERGKEIVFITQIIRWLINKLKGDV